MNRFVLVLFVLLTACNQDHEPGHGHGGDQDHGHGHGDAAAHGHGDGAAHGHGDGDGDAHKKGDAHAHGDAHEHKGAHDHPAPPTGTLSAFPVGAWVGSLEPAAETLRLALMAADGASVAPEGDAKVVVTAAGGEEQRLTLKASEGGWAGPAKLGGGGAFTAVVSVTVGGVTESGKVSWGGAPAAPKGEPAAKAEPAAKPHDHAHGEGGHGH